MLSLNASDSPIHHVVDVVVALKQLDLADGADLALQRRRGIAAATAAAGADPPCT